MAQLVPKRTTPTASVSKSDAGWFLGRFPLALKRCYTPWTFDFGLTITLVFLNEFLHFMSL